VVPPVSHTGEYLPHGVGLPDSILLGRDNLQVEIAGDLAQRQPIGAVLPHHADCSLLGAVLHELAVEVVEAESQVASSLALVPRDAEPVQGFQHPCLARSDQPVDLTEGQVLAAIEPLERPLLS